MKNEAIISLNKQGGLSYSSNTLHVLPGFYTGAVLYNALVVKETGITISRTVIPAGNFAALPN
jgi:hypothetical protein